MSKVVFDATVPLVSVVIGGLITYLTTRAMEEKKWKQQKKDKLQEQRLEAIAGALEWIPLIETSVSNASLLCFAYLQKHIGNDEFQREWPKLLSQLAEADLPMRQRLLLPAETHKRVMKIVHQLREFKDSVMLAQSQPALRPTEERIESVRRQLTELTKLSTEVTRELEDQYQTAFLVNTPEKTNSSRSP